MIWTGQFSTDFRENADGVIRDNVTRGSLEPPGRTGYACHDSIDPAQQQVIVVNSDLIKFIENAPDTVITLASGEKIVVLETAEEVITRIVEYRRRLRGPIAAIVPSDNVDEQPAETDDPRCGKSRRSRRKKKCKGSDLGQE